MPLIKTITNARGGEQQGKEVEKGVWGSDEYCDTINKQCVCECEWNS